MANAPNQHIATLLAHLSAEDPTAGGSREEWARELASMKAADLERLGQLLSELTGLREPEHVEVIEKKSWWRRAIG